MEMKTLKHILTILAVMFAVFGNMAAQNVPTLTLNNGAVMPQFGIGTYNQTNDQAYAGVLYALQHGYRHIDTAHAYGDAGRSFNLGYGNNGFGNFQDYTYNHSYTPAF